MISLVLKEAVIKESMYSSMGTVIVEYCVLFHLATEVFTSTPRFKCTRLW